MHPKIEKLNLDELAGGFFDIYVRGLAVVASPNPEH
jgi:hypothetical protein